MTEYLINLKSYELFGLILWLSFCGSVFILLYLIYQNFARNNND